jgi:uncharacterized repeat protein (TIGR01451 family)
VAGARNWTLTFAGTGGGSVTITPSTGTVNAPVGCGGTGTNAASQTVTGTCSPNISTSDNGATVTFSATAGGGSVFAGWSAQANLSSSTCTGTTSPCSAVLGGNAALTVTFNGASADLSIAKSGPATVLAGNTITYTLTAANGGPDPAQSVVVADTLPAVLSGAQFCVGSGCTPGAAWTGSAGLGTIVSGGSTTVTVTATVPAGTADGTVLSNQATVSSDTADPVPANNTSATLATTVHTSADLSIAKSGPASATAGASAGFDYTLTVANGGPSDESGGFHVTDTLPAGASFQATGSSAGCAAVGQVVTCSHAAGLAAGANASFTVHVEVASSVAEGAVLSNSATVASDGTNDPAAGNDTSNTVASSVDRSADLSVE